MSPLKETRVHAISKALRFTTFVLLTVYAFTAAKTFSLAFQVREKGLGVEKGTLLNAINNSCCHSSCNV